MFTHIYKYRILCNLRNVYTLFWMLVFPLVLAMLFQFALGGIFEGESFQRIPLAVVESQELLDNRYLNESLKEVSKGEDALFEILYVNKQKARQMLEDEEVTAYIEIVKEPVLNVKKSGITQSIVKSFLDQVKVISNTANALIDEDPQVLSQGMLEQLTTFQTYVIEETNQNTPDPTIIYFYTIFAMVCFYASFMGIEEVRVIQANQSYQAARIGISPTHKAKSFLAGICAALTLQCLTLILLFLFMKYGLDVSFGEDLLPIALTCFVGSICGLLFGSMLASLLKVKAGTNEGISAAVTMFMCFLAGMMNIEIKYNLEQLSPLFRYLNPVSLITDSLYALYYFDTFERYLINMSMLTLISLGFGVISFTVLRRQRYGSI